jgi:hypothetical protein
VRGEAQSSSRVRVGCWMRRDAANQGALWPFHCPSATLKGEQRLQERQEGYAATVRCPLSLCPFLARLLQRRESTCFSAVPCCCWLHPSSRLPSHLTRCPDPALPRRLSSSEPSTRPPVAPTQISSPNGCSVHWRPRAPSPQLVQCLVVLRLPCATLSDPRRACPSASGESHTPFTFTPATSPPGHAHHYPPAAPALAIIRSPLAAHRAPR